MAHFNHGLNQAKFNEHEFFLEVDLTESLYSAMSKIPKNFQNVATNEAVDNTESQIIKPLCTLIESKKNIHIECCKDIIEWEPFVELGAVHKLLNALKPDFFKFTESIESCFREIIFRLEKLLEDCTMDDKKIKNLLANDNSLVKCEQCGVISIKQRKNNRAIWKSFEKNTQNFKPQRLSKGRFENTSYSKVYEERKKCIHKDEKKNNFDSFRSTENAANYRNDPIRNDERCQLFFKYDDLTMEQIAPICGSMAAKREIDSILNKQKTFKKKFDKYSDRPLIEVSAPSRKASNIPRSNANLSKRTLNRKINKRNGEVEPKETKVDTKKSNYTIIRTEKIKDSREYKNIKEIKIDNQSKEFKLEEELDRKKYSNNGIQVNDLTNLEDCTNHIYVKLQDESNDCPETKKPSEKELRTKNQYEEYHLKHLSKGDCSSFQINEDNFSFSDVESLYPQKICGVDDTPLGFVHWNFYEEKYLEKNNLEAIKQEISLNKLKTVPSAENIEESELEESRTRGYRSTSEENLIREWMKSLKNSKTILKESKFLKKTLSVGIQTVCSPSLDIIQKIRAQITEAIDRFADYKMIESEPKKFDEHQENRFQMSYKNPSTKSSSRWAMTDLAPNHSEFFQKKIDHEKLKSPTIISTISLNEKTSKRFSMYTQVLEGNEKMDWETFKQLVDTLHPTQRQLWRDICKAVKDAAKRVAGISAASTEVCIEIKSVAKKKKRKEKKTIESGDEIAFGMDMTLKDMEIFLEKQLRSCLLGKKRKKIEIVEESLKK